MWVLSDSGVSDVSGEYLPIGGSAPLCGVEDREDDAHVEAGDRQIFYLSQFCYAPKNVK